MYKELSIEEIDVYAQMEECMVGMDNLKKKNQIRDVHSIDNDK